CSTHPGRSSGVRRVPALRCGATGSAGPAYRPGRPRTSMGRRPASSRRARYSYHHDTPLRYKVPLPTCPRRVRGGMTDGGRNFTDRGWRVRRALQHPARVLPLAFLAAIAISTGLLLLPAARADPAGSTTLVTALFTATTALCVTGLMASYTGHWSIYRQAVFIGSVT